MTARRTVARLLAAPAAAGVALLTLAGPLAGSASAHVSITPTETAAGASTLLTVGVSHGCDGAATTALEIQVPEEILSVTPSRNPLWTVTKTKVKLDKPQTDAHGNEVTERDGTIIYRTKTPLPEGYRDTFELSLTLPEKEGATLAFPTIQTCERGETAWVEVPADGQDPEELEHPAPALTVTAAEETDEHASGEDSVKESSEADADDEGSNTLGAVGLGAGVLGLIAGGAALMQVRRRA
jgi:uncharacterized protein YcnI